MVVGVRTLRKLQLAQYHGACFIQAAHHACIFVRPEISMHGRAGGCRKIFRPEDILQRNRNAVQRTQIPASSNFCVCGPGLRDGGVCHHMYVAAKLAVQSGNAVELRARHIQCRNLARLDVCREFHEFEVVQSLCHGILHSTWFDTSKRVIPRLIAVNR
jgi:hypothetical protein